MTFFRFYARLPSWDVLCATCERMGVEAPLEALRYNNAYIYAKWVVCQNRAKQPVEKAVETAVEAVPQFAKRDFVAPNVDYKRLAAGDE